MDHGKENFALYPTSTFHLKVRFYDSPVKKNLWDGSKQNLVRFMEAWTVSKKFFKASLKDAVHLLIQNSGMAVKQQLVKFIEKTHILIQKSL